MTDPASRTSRWTAAVPLRFLSGAVWLLLAVVLQAGCAAGLPAPAAGGGDTATGRPLAPGITHRFEQRGEGPWAIHVVEVDPAVCGVALHTVKGAGEMIGRETTSALFARFSAEAGDVAAAVNADFFRFAPDGVPEGPQVAGGEVVAAAGSHGPSVATRFGIPQPVFGVSRSGRPFVGEAALTGQAWSAEGTIPLSRINAAPGPDSLALFNRLAGQAVAGEPGQPRAVLRMLTRATAAGDVERAVVTRIDTTGAPIPLAPETRVVTGAGSAAAWVRALAVGDTIGWHLAFGGAPGAVTELVGGFPLLLLDGEPVLHRVPRIWPPFSTGRHPRTAVGIRADGTVLLVVVDGRQEGYSVGMSLSELTDLLLELGAVDALNLDGGGSTTLVTAAGIVNRPSDPEERPVANVLLARNAGCGGG